MSNERSTHKAQATAMIALGRFQIAQSSHHTKMLSMRAGIAELSDQCLARHLLEVASLARNERDCRLSEHLVDVAYDLASAE